MVSTFRLIIPVSLLGYITGNSSIPGKNASLVMRALPGHYLFGNAQPTLCLSDQSQVTVNHRPKMVDSPFMQHRETATEFEIATQSMDPLILFIVLYC